MRKRYVKLGNRYPLTEKQKKILDKLNIEPKKSVPVKDLAILLNSVESHHIVSKLVREYLNLDNSKLSKINGKVTRVLVIGK